MNNTKDGFERETFFPFVSNWKELAYRGTKDQRVLGRNEALRQILGVPLKTEITASEHRGVPNPLPTSVPGRNQRLITRFGRFRAVLGL